MSWRKTLACVAFLSASTLWTAEKFETVTLEITGMT
jgi:hypothetical protein